MGSRLPMTAPTLPNGHVDKETNEQTSESFDQVRDEVEPEEALEQTRSIDNAESLASVSQPATEPHGATIYHPLSVPLIVSLMPTAIVGLLTRLGLEAIATYDGQSIFSLAWVQALGCLIMGLTLGLKESIGPFYGPLYTGITTGFCGSLTTFSSWQLDIFLSWANKSHFHRDWFRDVIDGLSKTFFTLAISLSSVTLGIHLSKPVARHFPVLRPPPVPVRRALTAACILTYVATIPVYFRLSPDFRHQTTSAMLFSFPGALTRYILAVKVTPLVKLLPMGTLLANTSATALLGMFHVLQRTHALPSKIACGILQGLIDGYCGCLSTVSTFAVEVGAMNAKKAWLYVGLSWSISQLLLLVIIGPSWWRGGINEDRTCTFA
ncbi:hypothetical protein BD410DRAFT_779993 [Rickenella mellea]|uniref:CRCB-domain-containing protein n=1 Tax=Rickenella mellea TaxID=50990 RepID=A0A4R5XES8_9AGAM|nr:hypothetical protein BD410DRAFT_779993 [Rickenella mellea]